MNLNLLFVLYYAFKLSGPVVSGVAAPGLFFAIGGLIALGLSIYKGVEVDLRPNKISRRNARGPARTASLFIGLAGLGPHLD